MENPSIRNKVKRIYENNKKDQIAVEVTKKCDSNRDLLTLLKRQKSYFYGHSVIQNYIANAILQVKYIEEIKSMKGK